MSQRAAQLFQLIGDAGGEAEALVTHALAASFLGRNEEAVEAALLSTKLIKPVPLGPRLAITNTILGVAYFYGKSFDKATGAFESAVDIAARSEPPVSPFQSRVSQACGECVRVVTERFQTGQMPDLERMREVLLICSGLAEGGQTTAISKGVDVSLQAMWRLVTAAGQCWMGNLAEADHHVLEAQSWVAKYGSVTWLHAFESNVLAEIAWARRDWTAAELNVRRAVLLAEEAEHEQVACIAHLLASQIYGAQGKHELMLAELRRLARREQRIRIETLESKERVVQWQLDMRRTEKSLRTLEVSARHLEKLSLEDPLTRIANRRCFELRLDASLRNSVDSGHALYVALIDVDQFKQVNDRFSHQVGDEVLVVIARLLTEQVRQQDLVARLAGDEFVVVLQHIDAEAAENVCERMRAAIRQFDWSHIAPELAVNISLGLEQSLPNDTVRSLVHRSDAAMYRAKPAMAMREFNQAQDGTGW